MFTVTAKTSWQSIIKYHIAFQNCHYHHGNCGFHISSKITLLHCWWECKLIQPLWKTLGDASKKLGVEPQYNPANPLLGIYPEENKTEKGTCTPMFTTALFS